MDSAVSSSQVVHGKSRPFVMVRDEYLFLTRDDVCAAALLAVLENWTSSLSKSRAGTWITRSHRLLSEDMLGLYSAKRIGSAVTFLAEKGYIQVNIQPRSTSQFPRLLQKSVAAPPGKRFATRHSLRAMPWQEEFTYGEIQKQWLGKLRTLS